MEMAGNFNITLVTISVLVAMFASFVALNLSQNMYEAIGRTRIWWLGLGALAMGVGIWSMHFIGMLAFEMQGMTMAYDVPLMLLSMIVAIVASGLAFLLISSASVSLSALILGGSAMAVAIAGMHYLGMYSMRMDATIEWSYLLVALSVLIAFVASFGALGIFIRLRTKPERTVELLLASLIMGIAVSGMHYTGMLAANFVHTPQNAEIVPGNLLVTESLSLSVIFATLSILALSLIGSFAEKLWKASRKKDVKALDISEMRFKRLVEAVKDYAIFMLDTSGYVTTWNLGAERINGYTEQEVLGRHVSIFYLPEDISNGTADRELRIAAETGSYTGEGRRVRKDGSVYWASVVITPIYEVDGAITGFSKVTRDITLSRELERQQKDLNIELEGRVQDRTVELQLRESQLRQLTDAVPVLIAEVTSDLKLTFANSGFAKWMNVQPGKMTGRSFDELLGERYEANKPFLDLALKGETVSYDRKSTSYATGEEAILNVTFVPKYDSHGNVSGIILVATNVTRYKEIQAELEKAKDAAEEANRAKSSFLANMSHEIRTPLGAVIGFSELIVNEHLSASDKVNALEVIKRNGHLLSNIINDILDLSKVEAGKLELDKVEVPFTEVMKEIGSILNLEAIEKGLELTVTTEGPVPSMIYTDPLRLRQILVNLVGNAIKFTERGSVNVKVKLLQKGEGFTLAFVISDTGTGIDPDKASRLFAPFTQADASTTRKFGGTGLGLVLSRKLAQALGGDVELTSTTLGKGSTFTLTIDPGSSGQLLFKSSTPAPEKNVLSIHPERPTDLNGMKILLVEDSRDNQQLIKRFLGFAGAVVDIANNGREGVEAALKGEHALVLMDLQMPEMDGYEATRTLREAGFKKPILALTAHAMKEERERALSNGFDDHITKPIDQKALIKTLATYRDFETDSTEANR